MSGNAVYRSRRLLAPLLILAYVAGLALLNPRGHAEFFPFFNWSLFPQTTNSRIDWTLLIRSVDGQAIDPPLFYFDMKDTFSDAQTGNATLMKLVRRLGVAATRDDQTAVVELRQIVEGTFMRDALQVEYDLVLVHYDPIQRLRSGTVDAIETIASYTKGEP